MGKVVYLGDRACPRHAPNHGQDEAQRRQHILLAYPGRTKREYLAVFLASRGFDVTTCSNGREALVHLDGDRFDLVVTGILMSQMDGLELMGALRRRAGPPCIAMVDGSGRMDGIYLRIASLSGAVATHTIAEAGNALLKSVDWILRGQDDVIRDVVW
jgi:CheY-like chemotaxis protein